VGRFEEMETVQLAMSVARKLHEGQKRDGMANVPFFEHPCAVVEILRRCSAGVVFGEAIYSIGYLHDVVEDTGFPLAGVEALFGLRVAREVDLLTLRPGVGGAEKTDAQVGVMLSPETPDSVRAVKIADKTANLIDLVRYEPGWKLERIDRFVDRATRVVEAALCVPASPGSERCLRELSSKYHEARVRWESHR